MMARGGKIDRATTSPEKEGPPAAALSFFPLLLRPLPSNHGFTVMVVWAIWNTWPLFKLNVFYRKGKGPGHSGGDHQVPAHGRGEAEGGIGPDQKRRRVLINWGHPQGVAVFADDRGIDPQGVFLDGIAGVEQADEDVLPHLGGHRHRGVSDGGADRRRRLAPDRLAGSAPTPPRVIRKISGWKSFRMPSWVKVRVRRDRWRRRPA